jgi:seryl-tRNA synthetase
MTKSFKDNYAEMRVTSEPVITPHVSPVIIEPVKTILPETNVVASTTAVKEPRKEITTESIIKKVLTEQREQSAKVLESVMTSNKRLSASLSKIVKESTATNAMLVEAISNLADKIELLEAKLDVIKDLEIPTPIVHVQTPNSRVMKEIHRDTKGLITHITESEELIDPEDE